MRTFHAPAQATPRAARELHNGSSPLTPKCLRARRRSCRRSAARRCRATTASPRSRRCTTRPLDFLRDAPALWAAAGRTGGCDPLCLSDRRAATAGAVADRRAAGRAFLRRDDADHA
ncbi:hypothetical protein AB5I41_21790 [Sphingomonas sp. MMS24-JH45]